MESKELWEGKCKGNKSGLAFHKMEVNRQLFLILTICKNKLKCLKFKNMDIHKIRRCNDYFLSKCIKKKTKYLCIEKKAEIETPGSYFQD